jgi:hypothetical protein
LAFNLFIFKRRNNMKFKLALLGLIMTGGLSTLAACGDQDDDSAEEAACDCECEEAEEEVEEVEESEEETEEEGED